MFDTISVVGLGYIGLPTAAMFASRKKKVVGVDVSQKAVETINDGRVHFVEPGLDIIVRAVVNEGYLHATTTAAPADAFLIAVPTPFLEDKSPDLSYIEKACEMIAPVLSNGNLVVLESTSPVGTTEMVAKWLTDLRPDLKVASADREDAPDIFVAYCPERVLPGRVVTELVGNDRIIGGVTEECSKRAVALYKIFVEGTCYTTGSKVAEMTKLTENSFRDVNIAFANELSMICDDLDIDVFELIEMSNKHPRVNILSPGAGVGGHCIAVDPWFIISKHPDKALVMRQAREVNLAKPHYVAEKIKTSIADIQRSGKTGKEIVVALLGLAFKPDIDDLRESPALEIAKQVSAETDCEILVVEPNIETLPSDATGMTLVTIHEAIRRADIAAVLVAHSEFKGLGLATIKDQLLIDAVGI